MARELLTSTPGASPRPTESDAHVPLIERARPASPAAVLQLQRVVGNRAVRRWLGAPRRVARATGAPAETAQRVHEVIPVLAADVRRMNDTIKQMLPRGRFNLEAAPFVRRLDWLVDQLTWVTHAMGWAIRLADEAKAGGPDSGKKLAEAGIQLTAAIFGARAVSILLAYDAFHYEVAHAYNLPKDKHLADRPRDGALMAHKYLDLALANLSTRSPVRVDAAVDELLSYNWRWAFSQMVDETQEEIAAHARLEAWLNIVMLAWSAFDIWLASAGAAGGAAASRASVGWVAAEQRSPPRS